MIYGKLPVVFLTTIASQPSNSTNHHIAKVILEHLPEFSNISIVELANLCNVGTGSISRFCKEIGLQGFNELKELLLQEETQKDSPFLENTDVSQRIVDAITLASSSVKQSDLNNLASDMHRYQKIYAAGLLKAQNAVTDLQVDFYTMGKNIETSFHYKEQMDHILHASNDELILIFSYTGSYFEYDKQFKKGPHGPHIWMITGSSRPAEAFVNDTLRFDSMQNRLSHPFQLEVIASLIANTYRNKYGKEDV